MRVEVDTLEEHLAEIPDNRQIVVFSDCPCEEAADQALKLLQLKLLQKNGRRDVHKVVGGFNAYLEAGLPVEPVSKSVPASRIMLL